MLRLKKMCGCPGRYVDVAVRHIEANVLQAQLNRTPHIRGFEPPFHHRSLDDMEPKVGDSRRFQHAGAFQFRGREMVE